MLPSPWRASVSIGMLSKANGRNQSQAVVSVMVQPVVGKRVPAWGLLCFFFLLFVKMLVLCQLQWLL